jgi:hypothetical protein
MSLINEALKKAQRLRTEEPAGTLPPMPGAGGPRVARRSQPRTSQQLVVLAAAVVVLVMLTVVATVWLINRPAAPKPAPPVAATPAKPKAAAETPASTPILVGPVIKTDAPTISETPALKAAVPAPVTTASATAIVLTNSGNATIAAPTPTPEPAAPPPIASDTPAVPAVATQPAAVPPPLPAAEPKPDERIHAYVDAIRVMAIRAAGDDSRVQMNDRVFRINDIVDRGLGVRLTKVSPNSLTFTDANGASYVKNF